MGVVEVRGTRVLEEENRKLKQLVANLSLDKQMLQDVLRKSPEACSNAAPGRLPPGAAYGVSERRACEALNLPRGSYRRRSVADEQAALRMRIKDIAQAARVSYGYRRLRVLLQREGGAVNHKRVYRLYCREGLMLRNKKPKRGAEGKVDKTCFVTYFRKFDDPSLSTGDVASHLIGLKDRSGSRRCSDSVCRTRASPGRGIIAVGRSKNA